MLYKSLKTKFHMVSIFTVKFDVKDVKNANPNPQDIYIIRTKAL